MYLRYYYSLNFSSYFIVSIYTIIICSNHCKYHIKCNITLLRILFLFEIKTNTHDAHQTYFTIVKLIDVPNYFHRICFLYHTHMRFVPIES